MKKHLCLFIAIGCIATLGSCSQESVELNKCTASELKSNKDQNAEFNEKLMMSLNIIDENSYVEISKSGEISSYDFSIHKVIDTSDER